MLSQCTYWKYMPIDFWALVENSSKVKDQQWSFMMQQIQNAWWPTPAPLFYALVLIYALCVYLAYGYLEYNFNENSWLQKEWCKIRNNAAPKIWRVMLFPERLWWYHRYIVELAIQEHSIPITALKNSYAVNWNNFGMKKLTSIIQNGTCFTNLYLRRSRNLSWSSSYVTPD